MFKKQSKATFNHIDGKLENVFLKGPDSTLVLWVIWFVLQLLNSIYLKISHIQEINQGVLLYSNKRSFTETCCGPDLAGQWLSTPF